MLSMTVPRARWREPVRRWRQRVAAPHVQTAQERRERQKLELVFASMTDGLVIIEASGVVSKLNAAAKAIYRRVVAAGVDEGITQASLAELFTRYDPRTGQPIPPEQLQMNRALRGETSVSEELLFYTLDGRKLYIRSSSAPLRDPDGRITGVVALIDDITALKEAERLKDEFISIVSHELRTPLANIKGHTATLLREDVTWGAATQHTFLQVIDEECDKLTELIENLLDVSALRAGMLRIRPEPTLVHRLAGRVLGRWRGRAPDYRFEMDFPAGFPPALADPWRVEQVLRNLVENAVKYSPSGAHITVSGRWCDADVVVWVRDEGIGIPVEQRERIFERFHQVDGALTRSRPGTGLGLAICQGIVEAHGGRIWVESEVGHGSTFFFSLPRVPALDHEADD
ncbi:MAG: PAS domain-containing protein [Chloroflexi bacterium]|nr:PAS domain-containing protein [Chloroflexota bacterium]